MLDPVLSDMSELIEEPKLFWVQSDEPDDESHAVQVEVVVARGPGAWVTFRVVLTTTSLNFALNEGIGGPPRSNSEVAPPVNPSVSAGCVLDGATQSAPFTSIHSPLHIVAIPGARSLAPYSYPHCLHEEAQWPPQLTGLSPLQGPWLPA
jgi:hypothetical protein